MKKHKRWILSIGGLLLIAIVITWWVTRDNREDFVNVPGGPVPPVGEISQPTLSAVPISPVSPISPIVTPTVDQRPTITPVPSNTPSPTVTTTSSPTNTATPTVTSTPTAIPLPSDTPTPTVTPTATEVFTCQKMANQVFMTAWTHFYGQLRCATGDMKTIPLTAVQWFQGGKMFWRSDTQRIYAIFDREGQSYLDSGVWEEYVDTWDQKTDSTAKFTAPDGFMKPIRGFGHLWAAHPHLQSQLGWATTLEEAHYGLKVQEFENGLIMQFLSQVYVLYYNAETAQFAVETLPVR